jgi:uncharacterized protein YbjT (DUF2867 family)
MILVTGATGTVGSHVVRLLSARRESVRAMTRDPGKLAQSPGVEVVRADFEDPASLAHAVDGVDTVFLLTAPAQPSAVHDLALLDALRTSTPRVVRLSAIGTGAPLATGGVLGAWHLRADEALQDSGLAWTILRPTTFASNVRQWAAAINAGEPVTNLSGAGRQGIIDPRDVAAVAVEALTSDAHIGQTYTLTGPELLSVPDQADLLAQVLGRPVKTVDAPLDEARRQMLTSGLDSSFVDMVIAGSAYVRQGRNAVLTDDVARVLGRPPATFTTWATDHRTAFGPDLGALPSV